MRARSSKSRNASFFTALALAGCNALFDIEEATVRHLGASDAAEADGSPKNDGAVDSQVQDAPVAETGAGEEVSTLDAGDGALEDGASDGGADDASTDVSVDAMADTSADVKADAPVDAGSDAAPFTCTATTAVPASKSFTSNGPALAYVGGASPMFGLVWAPTTASIAYNAITSAGTIQNGADVTVAAGANTYAVYPRIATSGANFAVAYGMKASNDGGAASTNTQLRVLTPATGATFAGPGAGQSITESFSVRVGGVAVDPGSGTIASINRRAQTGTGSVARVDSFTSGAGAGQSGSPSSATLTTSIGLATATGLGVRFGAAFALDDNSGKIQSYVPSTLAAGSSFLFADPSAGASILAADIRHEVAIAGAGNRFIVAWVDGRAANAEIYLTSVDAATGAVLSQPLAREIKVSAANGAEVYFPRVAFDGETIAVAWVQGTTSEYDVFVRRFDVNLVPHDTSTVCVSCAGAHDAIATAIGLAASGPNAYGVAYKEKNGLVYFSHVTCNGP